MAFEVFYWIPICSENGVAQCTQWSGTQGVKIINFTNFDLPVGNTVLTVKSFSSKSHRKRSATLI